jgi:hypothetical protein
MRFTDAQVERRAEEKRQQDAERDARRAKGRLVKIAKHERRASVADAGKVEPPKVGAVIEVTRRREGCESAPHLGKVIAGWHGRCSSTASGERNGNHRCNLALCVPVEHPRRDPFNAVASYLSDVITYDPEAKLSRPGLFLVVHQRWQPPRSDAPLPPAAKLAGKWLEGSPGNLQHLCLRDVPAEFRNEVAKMCSLLRISVAAAFGGGDIW